MLDLKRITERLWVGGALGPHDFRTAKLSGISAVVNFQTDGESSDQLASAEARRAAEAAGLAYWHVPATKYDLMTDETLGRATEVFETERGHILAYCTSGQRAAIVWAATAARTQPVDEVLNALMSAGFDFDFLRDDLEAQADRSRWQHSEMADTIVGDALDQLIAAA